MALWSTITLRTDGPSCCSYFPNQASWPLVALHFKNLPQNGLSQRDTHLGDDGWKKLKLDFHTVYPFGVAVAKQSNLVYAIGGAMTFPGYAHVAVYNPETKEWVPVN